MVHEDPDLLVINKPGGLVCHPTRGDGWSSLVGRLGLYLGEGWHLLNRLDRETSGLCICAKNDAAAKAVRKQFEARTVKKTYLAIVHGWPAGRQRIEGAIGRDEESEVGIKRCIRDDGDEAITEFSVLENFERDGEQFSVLDVKPETGRTHQIRIHLAHAGYPIVGDKIYGRDPSAYLAFVRGSLSDAQRRNLRLPCHALHASSLMIRWQNQEKTFLAESAAMTVRDGDQLAGFGEFEFPRSWPAGPASS